MKIIITIIILIELTFINHAFNSFKDIKTQEIEIEQQKVQIEKSRLINEICKGSGSYQNGDIICK